MQTLIQVFQAVSDRTSGRAVAGDGGARYWNRESMDDLLSKQDWSKLMGHIYDVLDNHRCREAADWIRERAIEGHVPLLYIYLRNGVKHIGYRVLSTQEFKEWIQTWMMFCFRVVEDTVTCSSVMGLNKAPSTSCLIQKTMGWLAAYEVMEDWPSPLAMLTELGFGVDASDGVTDGLADTDTYSEDFEEDTSEPALIPEPCGESTKNESTKNETTKTNSDISSPSLTAISLLTGTTPPRPLMLATPSGSSPRIAFATPTWIPGFSVARVGASVYFQTSKPEAKRACMHNNTHFRVTQAQVRQSFLNQMVKELHTNDSWETWVKTIHQVMVDIPVK
jgi:hypothetical protein